MTYGYNIQWGRYQVEVRGVDSYHDARMMRIIEAVNAGWVRPKWWEFWRKDQPLEEAIKWYVKRYLNATQEN